MRNPLRKRLLRDLAGDAGKYTVIFILMVLSIGLISGFLVAANSMIYAYDTGFEKYNVEDGHFITAKKMNAAQILAVEDLGVTVGEEFYIEVETDASNTLRIYPVRESVNLLCLMDGRLPENGNEIVIDRMHADNNSLKIGDTVTSGSHTWTITGFAAFPDYSCLFSNNSDSMFDAIRFGVGAVTEEGFAALSQDERVFCYTWQYTDPPETDEEADRMSKDFLPALMEEVSVREYLPRYQNKAITFTRDDFGNDRTMMMVLLYIIIVIMAFVMTVIVTSTITKEAKVIGTLRASGYTKGELLLHYVSMPLMITVISAVIGNVMGYTFFKDFAASMYYNSYSLPTFVTLWNARAFLLTTVVPLVIMAVITVTILARKLQISPLRFLRGETSRRKNRRTLRLSRKIPFFSRFRMRVILQNLGNYAVILVGFFFADFLLAFGMLLPVILNSFQEKILDDMFAKYQYILTVPVDMTENEHKLESLISGVLFARGAETDNPDAEKFSAYSLRTVDTSYITEDIMLYGVQKDSRYIHADIGKEDVLISSAYAEKFRLAEGDTFTLKEAYEDKTYTFKVTGIYDYSGGLAVFMDQAALNRMMDMDADFFCGYFSDTPITDIDGKYIGTVLDEEALTKISRQLDHSFGDMMFIFEIFAVIIFFVLTYLMSKVILEKNAHSISMTKIMGYGNGELSRLYILPTTIMVLLINLICLPLDDLALGRVWRYYICQRMTGWMPYMRDIPSYIKMYLLAVVTYMVITGIQYLRIRRIPMDQALKNVE